MKKFTLVSIFIILFSGLLLKAQIYTENSGEIIFAFSEVERNMQPVDSKMRFTAFFHIGQNIHYDFTNNFGFFTGFGIRNIGLITKEEDIEIRRRTYSFGIPLAFKGGSFKDNLFFYGGGEYELFFHYKQKQFIDGTKTKESEWFSDRTNRFVPSLFAGIQFPKGINLKFKYYLDNFLNKDFTGNDFGIPVNYSVFNKTEIFYFSLSFNIKHEDIKKIYSPSGIRTAFL